jgi:alpha-tubulin suppressor-like RCC1 family protein
MTRHKPNATHLIASLLLVTLGAVGCSTRQPTKAPQKGHLSLSLKLPPLPSSHASVPQAGLAEETRPVPLALALKVSDPTGTTLLATNVSLATPQIEIELLPGDYVASAELLAAGVAGGLATLCTDETPSIPQYASSARAPFAVNASTTEVVLNFQTFESPSHQQELFLKLEGETSGIAGYTFLQPLSQQPLINPCQSAMPATGSTTPAPLLFPVNPTGGIHIKSFPLFTESPLTLALVTTSGTVQPLNPLPASSSGAPLFLSFDTLTQRLSSTSLDAGDFDGDKVANSAEVALGEDPFTPDFPVPTISDPAGTATTEDTAIAAVPVTISSLLGNLVCATSLTATSDNTTLLPQNGIAFSGTAPNCLMSLTPSANQHGTAHVALTLNDGTLSSRKTFALAVTAVNDAPTLAAIASPQTTTEDTAATIALTANDIDGPLACSSSYFAYTSSNVALVATSGAVTFGGTWPNCTATVTPQANATGSSNLTFSLSDGALAVSQTFQLSVVEGNDAPTITSVANATMVEDGSATIVSFSIADAESPLACPSSVTAISSNTALAPASNLSISGSGTNCTLSVTPVANQNGVATITLTVADGGTPALTAQSSFQLTVSAVNDAPTISTVTNQTTTRSVPVNGIGLTIADIDSTLSCASSITRTSSNTALLSNTNISVTGSAPNCSVGLVPSAGESGVVTVTLTVNDGSATANTSFTLSVNATPTKLAFAVQPTSSKVALGFNPLIAVRVQDNDGDLTTSGVPVTLQLSSTPAGITLGGTLTATTVNGVATFGDLTVNAQSSGLVLLAQSSGLTSALSTTFNTTVAAPTLGAPPVLAGTAKTSPRVTVSDIGPGLIVEFLTGADSNCAGGVVLASSVVASLNPELTIPISGGASSYSIRARAIDPLGNSACSATALSYTVNSIGTIDTGLAKVSLGTGHACAITSGALYCWGDNTKGQLGDGTTTSRSFPAVVSGLSSGVAAVSAGATHTCAITTSGEAKCWGNNTSGTLGDGSLTQRLTPVTVSGLATGVTGISAGQDFTCAVQSGAAKCWGTNYLGQLGNGTTTTSYTAVNVAGFSSGVSAIAAGANHACAIKDTALHCWGQNTYGQLGVGTTMNSSTPVPISLLASSIESIDLSYFSSCAVKAGSLFCWGGNGFGQLGDGSMVDRLSPVNVAGLTSGVTAFEIGLRHGCAVQGGALKCWGYNDVGQIGDGTNNARTNAVGTLDLTSNVTAVASGEFTSCAVQNGLLKCFGDNSKGQFGEGGHTGAYLKQPTASALSGQVTLIAKGFDASNHCAVQSGVTKCWGQNSFGQLGDGTTTMRTTPTPAQNLTSSVSALAVSSMHSCAIDNGAAKCWGFNYYGQIGDGTTTSRYAPTAVPPLTSLVSDITVSSGTTCAIHNGTVKCWGKNTYGQLGDETTTDRSTPGAVSGLSGNASSISAGATFVCALESGGVKCWGLNDAGQLGSGTNTPHFKAEPVTGLTSVTQLVAGGWHACVVQSGGVKCWGDNYEGQIGDGTTVSRTTPTAVLGLSANVTALASSHYSTCAIQSGALKCWGKLFGKTPIAIPGLESGVLAVSGGRSHFCALVHSELKCFGENYYSQLGFTQSTTKPIVIAP